MKLVKIELVGDDGTIHVFENGQPVATYYGDDNYIPRELQNYLESKLARYEPYKDEQNEPAT